MDYIYMEYIYIYIWKYIYSGRHNWFSLQYPPLPPRLLAQSFALDCIALGLVESFFPGPGA